MLSKRNLVACVSEKDGVGFRCMSESGANDTILAAILSSTFASAISKLHALEMIAKMFSFALRTHDLSKVRLSFLLIASSFL